MNFFGTLLHLGCGYAIFTDPDKAQEEADRNSIQGCVYERERFSASIADPATAEIIQRAPIGSIPELRCITSMGPGGEMVIFLMEDYDRSEAASKGRSWWFGSWPLYVHDDETRMAVKQLARTFLADVNSLSLDAP
jgi:hypothetical protein